MTLDHDSVLVCLNEVVIQEDCPDGMNELSFAMSQDISLAFSFAKAGDKT